MNTEMIQKDPNAPSIPPRIHKYDCIAAQSTAIGKEITKELSGHGRVCAFLPNSDRPSKGKITLSRFSALKGYFFSQ
jgi:hypothetical protein